jgi:transcriptional regulator with XRE-family HTH domain
VQLDFGREWYQTWDEDDFTTVTAGIHSSEDTAQQDALANAISYDKKGAYEFASLVKRHRRDRGVSVRDLSELSGIGLTDLWAVERGDLSQLTSDMFVKLVQALQLPTDQARDLTIFKTGVNCKITLRNLFGQLKAAGIEKKFVIQKLLPSSLREAVSRGGSNNIPNDQVVTVADLIGRVYSWDRDYLLSGGPINIAPTMLATTRFKIPSKVNRKRLHAYAIYVHRLAQLTIKATARLPQKPIPSEAGQVRRAILSAYGSLTFETALQYVWSLGIPVIPLQDKIAFDGACWRIEGRNVIALKLRAASFSILDLFHELNHVGCHPEQSEFGIVDMERMPAEYYNSPEEARATRYALDIALDSRAEELIQLCVKEANNSVEQLKYVVPKIAQSEGVQVDSLADCIAHRLSRQGINWWGSAVKLHNSSVGQWEIAKCFFLRHIDLTGLAEADRTLLLTAIEESED